MGKREFDPLGAFYAMAVVRASVVDQCGSKALYDQLRRELESSFIGSQDDYQFAVRKLARICKI